ncbi:MAG: hypothetical protein QNL04_13955 [SAR324 cluster bacterium]|nr:hypothetical protein [SAR324 cluster bacterium]
MKRKKSSIEIKFKVAPEAIKGFPTFNEIASEFDLHPSQVALWKKKVITGLGNIFDRKRKIKANL